jgi:hypothetical protein
LREQTPAQARRYLQPGAVHALAPPMGVVLPSHKMRVRSAKPVRAPEGWTMLWMVLGWWQFGPGVRRLTLTPGVGQPASGC